MSHPGTEETLLDEGESASGPGWRFGFWFWFLFGGFCLVLGLLVFFSPHHVVFPSPSMMTWALRPHGVRTRGKKFEVSSILVCWTTAKAVTLHLCREKFGSLWANRSPF